MNAAFPASFSRVAEPGVARGSDEAFENVNETFAAPAAAARCAAAAESGAGHSRPRFTLATRSRRMSIGDDGGDGVGDADFCGLLARRRGLRRLAVAGDAGGDENDAAAKMDGGRRSFAASVGDRSGGVGANGAARADALGFFLGVFLVRPVFGFGSLEPGANAPGANAPAPVAANGPPRGPASPNVGNVGGLAAGGGGVNRNGGAFVSGRARGKNEAASFDANALAPTKRGGSLDPGVPSTRAFPRPGDVPGLAPPRVDPRRRADAPLARRPPPDPRLNDRLENSVTGGVAK